MNFWKLTAAILLALVAFAWLSSAYEDWRHTADAPKRAERWVHCSQPGPLNMDCQDGE